MMKRWAYFLPVVFLGALALFAVIKLGQGQQTKSDLFEGDLRQVPGVELETISGNTLKWGDGETGPRIINLWATWCAPCKVEHPLLMQMAEQVPITGIAYKDDPVEITQVLKLDGNPFSEIGLDDDGMFGLSLGINAVPETFLVNSEGMIIKQYRGALTSDQAAEIVSLFVDMRQNQ
jgi:cytochrome c biogenesis protein CcmG/thiol:disulfide interchange protein DsbE